MKVPLMPKIPWEPLANFDVIYTNQSVEDFNTPIDRGVYVPIGQLIKEYKNWNINKKRFFYVI